MSLPPLVVCNEINSINFTTESHSPLFEQEFPEDNLSQERDRRSDFRSSLFRCRPSLVNSVVFEQKQLSCPPALWFLALAGGRSGCGQCVARPRFRVFVCLPHLCVSSYLSVLLLRAASHWMLIISHTGKVHTNTHAHTSKLAGSAVITHCYTGLVLLRACLQPDF